MAAEGVPNFRLWSACSGEPLWRGRSRVPCKGLRQSISVSASWMGSPWSLAAAECGPRADGDVGGSTDTGESDGGVDEPGWWASDGLRFSASATLAEFVGSADDQTSDRGE